MQFHRMRVGNLVCLTALSLGVLSASPSSAEPSDRVRADQPVPTLELPAKISPQLRRSSGLSPVRIPSIDSLTLPLAAMRKNALQSRNEAKGKSGGGAESKPSVPVERPKASGPIEGDNDAFPYEIVALPYFDANTTAGFNDDYTISCEWGPSSAPDVVYRYTADHDHAIAIALCNSSYDTKLGIAYASDPSTIIACNDDFCGVDGFRSSIESLFLLLGDEILIIVDGYDDVSFGDYELEVWEVTGEDEFDPIVITTLPYYAEYTTDFTSNDYDEPCPDSSTSGDVVFRYRPATDQRVTIDLCNSSYDTKIFVYENTVTPGSPFACNEDGVNCPEFQSHIECLQLYGGNTYYIVVDGWGNQTGPFVLDITECPEDCWAGCVPEATLESEQCGYLGPDTVNGGCTGDGKVYLIQPNEIVCGTMEITNTTFDTDWYARYLFEGDSITWCVTANLPFEAGIMDLTFGCNSFSAFGSGFRCDTVYLGMKVMSDGFYAFVVQPSFGFAEWPCAANPEYQAQLIVDPRCKWGGCPIVSIPENEGCDEGLADTYDGGCYSAPPSFFDIPDNQYVCGLTWRTADNWDEDVYRRHTMPGETVVFAVQAEFPVTVYIYDIGSGCEYNNIVEYAEARPCEILTLQATPEVETDLVCVVFATEVGNRYSCASGPWEYTIICNAASACPNFACNVNATDESEACEITAFQGYNAGCNSVPPTYFTINYDEIVCGKCWYGTTGYSFWRDTDWHDANVADGDSVVWCVTAEFAFDAFIVDVSPNCDFDSNVTIVYDTGYACDTIYLSTRKQPGQDLKFIIAPRFFFPWIWCETGERNWEATLTRVADACLCDCAHDPACDSLTDIFDVTQAVNVAFRNASELPDPNASCPWQTTDVNCDGLTDIFDVTRLVNVAFRNGDPGTEFCNPCNVAGDSPE